MFGWWGTVFFFFVGEGGGVLVLLSVKRVVSVAKKQENY